jgi:hypothetical protein
MNIPTVNNQPVSDDNDLAKVLSGAEGQLADVAPPVAPEPVVVEEPVAPATADEPLFPATGPTNDNEALEAIKKQALEELRPLVDKLELPPEEKFDILLLIIRSTDDEELVAKAHETAIEIQDETRKAQALLDIIKEVDYFSNK